MDWTIPIGILIMVLSGIFGFFLGRNHHNKKIKKTLSEGTGKMGIIKFNVYTSRIDVSGFYEVEEIETAGDMVKVKLHNISTIDRGNISKIKDKFRDWVESKTIIWYDSNSQKVRNTKLNNILEDNI